MLTSHPRAGLGVAYPLVNLLHEHGGLVVGHAEVASTAEAAAALVGADGTPNVMVRLAAVEKFIAVSRDGPAVAGGNMFGVLETEAAQVGSACRISLPPEFILARWKRTSRPAHYVFSGGLCQMSCSSMFLASLYWRTWRVRGGPRISIRFRSAWPIPAWAQ